MLGLRTVLALSFAVVAVLGTDNPNICYNTCQFANNGICDDGFVGAWFRCAFAKLIIGSMQLHGQPLGFLRLRN
jgi:hypothetical protein